MKLQGMSILYVIIIIPMLVVLSLTLSNYKNQLNNSLKYDSELTGAVNDAITAFELNSASQNYSNVSDNFTSLVEASVNIFTRSIATRLNMTNADESLMNRYFPLALFTGYSGYYIYSPTYSPIVVKNPYTGQAAFSSDTTPQGHLDKESGDYNPDVLGDEHQSLQYTPVLFKHIDNDGSISNPVKITTSKDLNDDILAKEEIAYSLKQMIPYTLELDKKDSNNKILLNYTLDNYISFTGKVKGIAYNKSGFLLNNMTSIELKQGSNILYNMNKLDDELFIHHLTYFDEYVDDYIEKELTKGSQLLTLTIEEEGKDAVSIVFNPSEYVQGYADYVKEKKEQMTGQYAYQRQQLDAIKYYIKAANFSNFVYKNLGGDDGYKEEHIQEIDLGEDIRYKKYFLEYDKNNNESIFPTSKNVLDSDSTFNEVKRKAIRNSVQYDLIIATQNYNYLVSSSDFLLNLPVITDPDWDRIVENVSFTAFLQGLSTGSYKKYNNYAIATSTMNEFVINPNTIYFSDIVGFNQANLADIDESNELYFHKINCPDFIAYLAGREDPNDDSKTGAIGFKMSAWIYDARWSKEKSKYIYDHKNYSHFKCIANYTIKDNLTEEEQKIVNKNVMSAVAAEKERSFKPNYVLDAGGYKSFSSAGSLSLNIKNIKGFEFAGSHEGNTKRKFLIDISAVGKSSVFEISRDTSNVLIYPYKTSDTSSENYTIYKHYITKLMGMDLGKIKWSDIDGITVMIVNEITNDPEPLKYVKVMYI